MAIRIHFNPASQHARRVQMVAQEIGATVDWKLVDLAKGENQQPSYLALNPAGKVPTLEDGNFVIWESNAIMAFLCDVTNNDKAKALYPNDPHARADVNRWLFWESAHFGPPVITLTWERLLKQVLAKQPADQAVAAQAEAHFKRFAPILNGRLEGKDYVCGKLSIADFSLASIVMYHEPIGLALKSYPHLWQWFERMSSRDSWKATQG